MWAYESTFYQIYPIGFCGAPLENDGQTFARIRKVIEWSSYLEDLGIDCVLFNPIFQSDSHGYDTRDFKNLDCRLGRNQDFADVCENLHSHNIRIVLDGVFNHVGRGFWAFQDVLENRENSPYKDWFYIDFNGNSKYNDQLYYEGWEGHYGLVKLNLQNPAVVDYLLECVKEWYETFHIDGLRLDVAYCLDPNFMRRLHDFCQQLNPDFVLIGEVLFGDYNQLVNKGMLQSCTNYEVYKGIYSSLNDLNLFEIAHSLNRQFGPDQWSIYKGKHLMTFVDNHDVTRIASILKNPIHLPIAYALLMGMPGIPCIYYGSEWGEPGVKAPDNDYALRPYFENPAPTELTGLLQALITIRKGSKALCYGDYKNVVIMNQQLIFQRSCDEERVLVAVNISDDWYTANFPELSGHVIDLLNGEEQDLGGQLNMAPYSIQFLRCQ